MRWRVYPKYKDSGVEWLGRVPEHWELKALRRVFKTLNGSTPRSSEPRYWDGEIPWATPDDLGKLQGTTLQTTERLITQEGYDSCGTSLAPQGSLILSTRAPIGHLAIAGTAMCTNQGCRSLVFKGNDSSRYFYYLLLASQSELESWGQGSTFKELARTKLDSVYLAVPTLLEQHTIAFFLDRETERIDALIARKERQIELLQEKRAALISHAVTRGVSDLNEDSKSIQWVEARLGRFIKLQRGFDITGASECDGSYPVFSSGGLSGYSDSAMVDGPGVIVGRKGTLGTVHYSEGDYWPHDTTLWVKEFRGNHSRFVYYFLVHMRLERFDVGAANPTLNRNHVHPIPVRFPDPISQRAIAKFLDEKVASMENLIQTIAKSISVLHEYRTALISAAVTGRIDVRP